MRRKKTIDIKAAFKLIVAENRNALRNLIKSITNSASKPTYLNKKTRKLLHGD